MRALSASWYSTVIVKIADYCANHTSFGSRPVKFAKEDILERDKPKPDSGNQNKAEFLAVRIDGNVRYELLDAPSWPTARRIALTVEKEPQVPSQRECQANLNG